MPLPLRYRQIHLDFHTSPDIEGVGADFDPDEFADTLARAHVDSVTVFARCHHGHLYYPSARFPERVHPHLARPNLLPEQIEACHKRGINAPIYVTVQWDQFTADRHRDWLCLDAEGKEYGTAPFAPGFYRNLDVFHPGYRQFLFDHVAEICETMPAVDGFFFDIVQPFSSCALHWKEAMAKAGLDSEDEAARGRFAVQVIQDWEREMTAFVRERAPGATLFYNSGHVGPRHRPVADAYTHWELESLPSGGWGYMHFPQAMRYARTLGRECLGMTGKFHTSWGDFGSYKNPAALQFECFQMVALGAVCSVGDQLPPRGRLDPHTYELIGPVYGGVEAREPFCKGAVPVNEVAVLSPEAFVQRRPDFKFRQEREQPAVVGAIRMLQELRVQFDIVDDQTDYAPYKMLVLPDEVVVDDTLAAKLSAYVAAGGSLIASHRSGLAGYGADAFSPGFTELFGVRYDGDAPFSPDFVTPTAGLNAPEELTGTAHVMYKKGSRVEVEAADGTETLATLQSPYFNRTWRHFCSHLHAPPAGQDAGYPAAVRKGNCVYFAHPIFGQYQANAPRWCRTLVASALDLLLSERLVTAENAPTTLLTALSHQPAENRHVLHLLHYIPERRGQAFDTIEDVIPLHDLTVSVKTPSPVRSATLEPGGAPLSFTQENGRVRVTVPKLEGHAMVVLAG